MDTSRIESYLRGSSIYYFQAVLDAVKSYMKRAGAGKKPIDRLTDHGRSCRNLALFKRIS